MAFLILLACLSGLTANCDAASAGMLTVSIFAQGLRSGAQDHPAGALPHQECYRRTDRQEWDGDTESDRCRRWQDGSAWVRGARSRRRW